MFSHNFDVFLAAMSPNTLRVSMQFRAHLFSLRRGLYSGLSDHAGTFEFFIVGMKSSSASCFSRSLRQQKVGQMRRCRQIRCRAGVFYAGSGELFFLPVLNSLTSSTAW